jgi:CelD/BcsL family acetyltransferase involved in cellulose biosynthesis
MDRKMVEKEQIPVTKGKTGAAQKTKASGSDPERILAKEKAITVLAIRSREELGRLASAWTDLLTRSQANEIFLTWEWVSTWVDVYLGDSSLMVLAVYKDDALIGLAPLWLQKVRGFGVLNIRELGYLGTGEVCSDHLDMILDKEHGWEAAHAIWDYLFGPLRHEWDILKLEQTPQSSAMARVAHHMAQEDRRCIRYDVDGFSVCPYVVLPASYEELMMSLGQKTRFNINKSTRQLQKQGEVTFTTCSTERELEAVFAWVMETHKKTWARKGQFGGFALDRFREFHTRISRILLSRDWLALAVLRVNNTPVAATYSFRYNGVTSGYLAAVDFDYDRRLSVGRLLLARSIELAISAKCRIFDMLRGEEPYKYHWTNRDRRNISMILYNGSVRGLLLVVFATVRNLSRSMFRTLVGTGRPVEQVRVTGSENLKANLRSD